MDGKEKYMALALSLAERGRGWTSPNPMVGAVIVKDGRIIGEGWHEKYGEKHAERNALDSATESVEGATMYVTLEPCSHYGKQPPCTDAIIEARLKKVVVGSGDPNPLVNGRGFEILKNHGIEVEYGVLEGECKALNKHFFHYITNKKPYVSLKYAMTVDGNKMTISVPLSMLGLSASEFSFGFKVADNVTNYKDIMDYYVSGDSAPIGRLRYSYGY